MAQLDELMKCEVSSVNFVRDYFELHFDGPVLRILGEFALRKGDTRFVEGTDFWRDALCSLIGLTPAAIAFNGMDACSIRFSNDVTLEVDLLPSDRSGPETMHFMPGDGGAMLRWESDEFLSCNGMQTRGSSAPADGGG